MAGGKFFALLDDIATVLDDVSLLTKVAAQKTAGVLGDDLALNAQQVAGVSADRELPVVWAVAKGSLVNKAILVPAALAISALTPRLVIPLLMVGGVYLCYEGFEKIAHKLMGGHDEESARRAEIAARSPTLAGQVASRSPRSRSGPHRFYPVAEIIDHAGHRLRRRRPCGCRCSSASQY